MYHSLTKERSWADHLTSLPKSGVGAHHLKASMSCLQQVNSLETNYWKLGQSREQMLCYETTVNFFTLVHFENCVLKSYTQLNVNSQ